MPATIQILDGEGKIRTISSVRELSCPRVRRLRLAPHDAEPLTPRAIRLRLSPIPVVCRTSDGSGRAGRRLEDGDPAAGSLAGAVAACVGKELASDRKTGTEKPAAGDYAGNTCPIMPNCRHGPPDARAVNPLESLPHLYTMLRSVGPAGLRSSRAFLKTGESVR